MVLDEPCNAQYCRGVIRLLQVVVDHGLRALYPIPCIWLPLRDPYRCLLIVTVSIGDSSGRYRH